MALHQIEIPRRTRACALKGEEFTGGTPYVSLIEYDGKGVCHRKDYCESCWKTVEDKAGKVYWKSQVPLKPVVSDLKREERALELLRDCGNEQQAEAFVLALLLARSKHLILRQEIQEEEHTLQLYEIKATEEMLAIKKMNLTPAQIEEVKQKLAQHLS